MLSAPNRACLFNAFAYQLNAISFVAVQSHAIAHPLHDPLFRSGAELCSSIATFIRQFHSNLGNAIAWQFIAFPWPLAFRFVAIPSRRSSNLCRFFSNLSTVYYAVPLHGRSRLHDAMPLQTCAVQGYPIPCHLNAQSSRAIPWLIQTKPCLCFAKRVNAPPWPFFSSRGNAIPSQGQLLYAFATDCCYCQMIS